MLNGNNFQGKAMLINSKPELHDIRISPSSEISTVIFVNFEIQKVPIEGTDI